MEVYTWKAWSLCTDAERAAAGVAGIEFFLCYGGPAALRYHVEINRPVSQAAMNFARPYRHPGICEYIMMANITGRTILCCWPDRRKREESEDVMENFDHGKSAEGTVSMESVDLMCLADKLRTKYPW
ncbi:MAG: hypothetical protein ACLVJO_16120 [[Clostridium] scindens]